VSTHPYLPLYVDDYEAATAHLSAAEDGVYSRLLRLCWRTPGCSLPNDHAWIARKIRLSTKDFETVARPVLEEFFKLSRGRLIQKRLKAEYDDISRKKSARAKAGKKGGDAKAQKLLTFDPSNATDLPAHTGAFPNPEPEPEKKKEAIASSVAGSDVATAFAEWNVLAQRLSLPIAKALTADRKKHLKARLAADGLDGWRDALAGVEASAHCRGENDRGWKADIDFVAQPKSFQRLRERFYGGQQASAGIGQLPVAAWSGPPAVRASIVKAKDEDFARKWVDPYCSWSPMDRTLLVSNAYAAKQITQELPGWFTTNNAHIAIAPANDTPPLLAHGAAA